MLVRWINPTPDDSCPTCSWFRGMVFDSDMAPPLPAHPHCDCYYQPELQQTIPDDFDWASTPPEAKRTYIYYVAYLLRIGVNVPDSLKDLIPEAEEHNRQREQKELSMPNSITLNNYQAPSRVDRENHILYGVSVIQAVEAMGHNAIVDDTAVFQIVVLGQAAAPTGIKSRFTHPGLSADGTGRFLGRLRNFRLQGDKALADLHLSRAAAKSPDGDLRDYVETLAEDDPKAVGFSIHAKGDKMWILPDGSELDASEHPRPDTATTELPVFRFTSLTAVDIVDEPAANRDGLFSSSHRDTNQLAANAFAMLDQFCTQFGYDPHDLPNLIHAAYHSPHSLKEAEQYFIETQLTQLYTDLHTDDPYIPESYAKSFIHRYVQARAARPLSISQGELIIMSNQTQPDPTAVPEAATPAPAQADAWLSTLGQTVSASLIQNSGLPTVTQQRLLKGSYDTPEAVQLAIQEARDEVAALSADDTISIGGSHPRLTVTSGDIRTPREMAQSHIDYFFGVEGATPPPANYRSLQQLYIALTGDLNFYGKFDEDNIMLAGASTSDLAEMAANAMNKVIMTQWSHLAHWRWYERVAYATPNDGSVQDMRWTTVGGIQNLPTVAEKAAYTELDMDDVAEANSFVKQGGYVGISIEMIRNSDILRIQAAPRALAAAAVRTRSATISAIFTANSGVGPTLDQDSTALFHASHSNVDTTAFSEAAWRAARTEAFSHTEIESGKALAVFPRYALVPVDLYDTALSLFGYGEGYPTAYTPEAQGRGNHDPRPVPLVVPDWTDSNNWAYVVDPLVYPVIHMSYAQSPAGGTHPLPELFAVTSPTAGMVFTNDTLPVKVRDWFAAGVNGPRGIGKRNVA